MSVGSAHDDGYNSLTGDGELQNSLGCPTPSGSAISFAASSRETIMSPAHLGTGYECMKIRRDEAQEQL